MNPVDRLNLQETKTKASQAALLVSQGRMQAKGAAAATTGPVGAIKGAGLVAAAGGVGAVNSQMGTQLTSIATQKSSLTAIDQLKAQQAKLPSGPQKDAVKKQINDQQAQLKQAKKAAQTARDAARTALPNILKILRQVQF